MSAHLTVSLIDDHADTRALWRRVLARQADLTVLNVFADAESALAHFSALAGQPDHLPLVILVDWHLGEGRMDGIEFIRQLKALFPGLRCILITAYDLDHLPSEAARCGADGFIYKSEPLSLLPDRIRAAHAGQNPLSDRAAQHLFQTLRNEGIAASAALAKLTPCEREVLHLVGEGRTEKEAAAQLNRSVNTLHHQLTSAYAKLGVHNRAEAQNVLRGGGDRTGKPNLK